MQDGAMDCGGMLVRDERPGMTVHLLAGRTPNHDSIPQRVRRTSSCSMRTLGRGVRRPALGIVSAGAIREWPALGRSRAGLPRGKRITRGLWPLVLAVAGPTRMAGCSAAGVGLGDARSHKRHRA